MAQIFSAMAGMRGLMDYWYHFAIMFEALFVLTTVDAGTRVGRFIIQEFLGRLYKPFEKANAFWPSLISTAVIVSAWTYFLWTGSISTLWPLFGIANQLLAGVGLAIGTTMLINMGRPGMFSDCGPARSSPHHHDRGLPECSGQLLAAHPGSGHGRDRLCRFDRHRDHDVVHGSDPGPIHRCMGVMTGKTPIAADLVPGRV
jgi:hypothetical protein